MSTHGRVATFLVLGIVLASGALAENVEVFGEDGEDRVGEPGGDAPAAIAIADAPGEDNRAYAEGGDGGSGTVEGRGGDATAQAIVTDARSAEATARAGFSFGENNGDALAEATVDTSLSGAIDATARAEYSGDTTAIARAESDASSALVTVLAEANAFETGSNVLADAYAVGPTVDVTARVDAPNTPSSNVTARAEGHSLSGGDVRVAAEIVPFAFGGASPRALEAALHDAVSGSTAGTLTLVQSAVGRNRVSTSLDASNPGGGDLVVEIDAASAQEVVLGDVTGVVAGDRDVRLAFEGSVQQGALVLEEQADGLPPTRSRVYGQSDTGLVEVIANVRAASFLSEGFEVAVENLVDGDTSGNLILEQNVETINGAATDARSVLRKDAEAISLDLTSTAVAGTNLLEERSGASSVIEASNTSPVESGTLRALAYARGGNTSDRGNQTPAGDAEVRVDVSTSGDRNTILVGEYLDPASSGWGARGGASLFLLPRLADEQPDGGAATSFSRGEAFGSSTVEVFDLAIAGFGDDDITHAGQGRGGDGGAATSTAEALGGGTRTVRGVARAEGGNGGTGFAEAGNGGDAIAEALASGLGLAEARALALGGTALSDGGEPSGHAGTALARASAVGATGLARAEARSGMGLELGVSALSSAELDGALREVVAFATHTTALADAPGAAGTHGAAFLTAAPLLSDADHALAGNEAMAAQFAAEGGSEWLALGTLLGDHAGGDASALVLSNAFEITLAETPAARGRLVFGAYDLGVEGDAFTTLELSFARNGETFGETLRYETVSDLLAALDDTLFELGTDLLAGDVFQAQLEVELGAATRLASSFGFALIVPEPTTAPLLAFGLLLLARASRASTGRRTRRAPPLS